MISLYGGTLQVTGGYLQCYGVSFALTTGAVTIQAPLYAMAPTGPSPTYGLQDILFVMNSGNFTLSNNTSQLGGMIYAPNSTVTVSGTADAYNSQGGCLGVAAGNVVLSGSATVSVSPCTGFTPTSVGSSISLYQ